MSEIIEIRGRLFDVPDNGALVLTVTGDEIQSQVCTPDNYVLICGPDRYVGSVQAYPAKGTHVLTIKTDTQKVSHEEDGR